MEPLDLTPEPMECMRCHVTAPMRFYGLCPTCRDALAHVAEQVTMRALDTVRASRRRSATSEPPRELKPAVLDFLNHRLGNLLTDVAAGVVDPALGER